jgi:hypothetical protein
MSDIEQSVHAFTEAMNAQDVDSMLSVFADDAVIRFPGAGTLDLAGFRGLLVQVGDQLASNLLEEKQLFINEYGAAVVFGYDVVTKSGRTAHVDGVDAWVFGADGRAVDFTVYGDVSPLMQAVLS